MNALLIFLLLLLGSVANAQQAPYVFSPLPLDSVTRMVVYKAIVPVEGTSKDQLFARAQHWLTHAVPAYKGSVRLNKPETGTLQMRGTLKNGQESFGFRLSIFVRHNRYKYQLDNVTYTQPSFAREGKYSPPEPVTTKIETLVYTRPKKSRNKKLTELNARLEQVLAELNATMQQNSDGLATQL